MEQIITESFRYIAPAALPVVITVLGVFWIWRKTQNIEDSRKTTKRLRDEELMKIHDELLKHSFQITSLEGTKDLHRQILDDLQKQMSIVVKELTELNVNVKILIDERNK